MQRSICSFESLFLCRKQEKVMKAFSFNILLLHYVCREGFLQPVGKQVGNIVKTSEKFLAKELITAYGINVY